MCCKQRFQVNKIFYNKIGIPQNVYKKIHYKASTHYYSEKIIFYLIKMSTVQFMLINCKMK